MERLKHEDLAECPEKGELLSNNKRRHKEELPLRDPDRDPDTIQNTTSMDILVTAKDKGPPAQKKPRGACAFDSDDMDNGKPMTLDVNKLPGNWDTLCSRDIGIMPKRANLEKGDSCAVSHYVYTFPSDTSSI